MNHGRSAVNALLFKTAILFLLVPMFAHSEQPPIGILNSAGASYYADLDWQTRNLRIKITAPIDSDASVRNNATLLSRKQDELQQFFPSIFPLCLHDVQIDSKHVLQDLMQGNTDFSLGIQSLAQKAILIKVTPSRDLRSISLEYQLSLFPNLSGFLVQERTPDELEHLLTLQAPADYTGLVIYAKDKVLHYGTEETASVLPSLFPRIYDEDGRLILDRTMLNYQSAVAGGIVEYRSSMESVDPAKVGKNPLVVTLRAVYGDSPTDLMISRNDADILLYNKSTRDALVNGKIVVIVDAASLKQKLVH